MLVLAVEARTGTTTQVVETRARARQGVAVAQDASDGGTGGSGLQQEGLLEGWGGEETK